MNKELADLVFDEMNDFHQSRIWERLSPTDSPEKLIAAIDRKLPDVGEEPKDALKKLIEGVRESLIHSSNPRYFGFVIGGTTDTATAADWLTSIWDQNAQVYHSSPAAAIVEDVVRDWILDLLRLPPTAGVGLVTGAQMANFVGLTVGRNHVLQECGWDVDGRGLQDAPRINVVCGACCHATIHSAIRLMGLGSDNILEVAVDEQGRILTPELESALSQCTGPTIVCLQAGNVNTGASDNFQVAIKTAHDQGAWVHVDGAFGLWAQASPQKRHLTAGVEQADSWSVDGHKWLNVPYDSGLVIVRDAASHQNLKTARCAYAGDSDDARRDGSVWVPENSRRARAFVLYAALRNLGRDGVARLVDNGCDRAAQFAVELSAIPSVTILNDVVLNQVLFSIAGPDDSDAVAYHDHIARRVRQSGECWIGTTQWRGAPALRISISHHATSEDDVSRSVACVQAALLA